jgi:Flp pilus assembly protein TadG
VAAAEMAIVLPLLALLIVGCIDFGRFAHTSITVTNAARTGAEVGSMNAYTTSTADLWEEKVRQATVDEMARMDGFDSTRLTMTVTRVTDDDYPRVVVEVIYPFETLIEWPGLPSRVDLGCVGSMPMTRF